MTESVPLNKRQGEILRFVVTYQKRKRYAPTLQEISDVVGVPVYYSLNALERKGYIRRQYRQPRAILVLHDPDHPKVCPACERPFAESGA